MTTKYPWPSPVVPGHAFATHLPVLRHLGATLPIERVIELGCGPYSTPTFLEYPQLRWIASYEEQIKWAQAVLSRYDDPRLNLFLHSRSLHESIESGALSLDADLIFVDNSMTVQGRSLTLAALEKRCPDAPLIVVHDWEEHDFDAPYVEVYDKLTPQTAVCWTNNLRWGTDLGVSTLS